MAYLDRIRKMAPMRRFLYWIEERENIRLAKEEGLPAPWTTDPILQSFRFCNVRRMDDAVSVWLYDNWYKPNFDHPMIVVAAALARFINKPSSLEAIGFPEKWDARRWKATLNKLKEHGPIFNAAYLVRAEKDVSKVDSVIDNYVRPLHNDPLAVDRNSMENTWAQLVQYHGFGSFTAGQVVADLRWAMKGKWVDSKKWAPLGPGSQRGLNRLLGYDINTRWKQQEFELALLKLKSTCIDKLDKSITSRLEAHDYQNCLCEFDKYNRCLQGGRAKQIYPGV